MMRCDAARCDVDGSDEEVMVEVKATPSRAGSRRRPVLDKTDSNVPLRFSAYALPAAGANSTPDVEESRSAPSTPRNSRQPKLPSNFNGDATPSRRPPSAAPDTVKKSTKDEVRYPWLENPLDAQRRKPTDPDYDKQTLYIPPSAWAKFTPFEKQFWEIKSKYWDTIVFFKKGSFYEMYDKDAFIAHQEFDLRKSDRINMAMSGVPESSFEHWASKFIAKGYKIAKVDQMETSIGKTMRERGSSQKAENIIRRELTAVLTAGTLVDPKMLTHDLATYCMAIVEAWPDSGDTEPRGPSFGIAFVDAATAQFW
ncbi:DNA mismatch repair protein msh6, partial [Spiromyces aspiralis]